MVDKKTSVIAILCVASVLFLGLWVNAGQEAQKLEGALGELEDDYVVKPTVTTQAASNKSWRNSGYDATLNGTITDMGGEDCTERGFEWGSSSGDYTQGWNEGPDPFGTGTFDRRDSFHGTVYYRAYAMNSAGYGYGNERVFSPPPPPVEPEHPTVTTQDVTDKSWKNGFYWATLHGTIVDTGGENCTQGFEWGSSSGDYTQGYELEGTHGVGPFEHIDSFSGTVYYRAYARNSEGEDYGSEKSFTPPSMKAMMRQSWRRGLPCPYLGE